jgi:lipoprotein-anchoring transpeptidase ErfK/SrfK
MKQDNHQPPDWITTTLARWSAAAIILALFTGCAQMQFPSLPEDLTGSRSGDDSSEQQASGQDDATEVAEQPREPEPIPEPQEKPKPGQLYEWSGDGRSITRIVIDTNEQKARFYSGADQVGWTTIASGVSKHPTPRGEFAILEKVRDKRSNLYGKIVNSSGKVVKGSATGKDPVPPGGRFVGANMPHFMRMTFDGIGMHAGPIPRPGHPASHGCIRMPKEVAAAVFKHANNGTPVTVIGNGPDYGNYAERVARQQAEERARRAAVAAAAEGTPLDGLDAEIESIKRAETASSGADSGIASAVSPSAGAPRQRAGAAPSPPLTQSPSQAQNHNQAPSPSAASGAATDEGGEAAQAGGSSAGSGTGTGSGAGSETAGDTQAPAGGSPDRAATQELPSYSPPPPPPRVRSAANDALPDAVGSPTVAVSEETAVAPRQSVAATAATPMTADAEVTSAPQLQAPAAAPSSSSLAPPHIAPQAQMSGAETPATPIPAAASQPARLGASAPIPPAAVPGVPTQTEPAQLNPAPVQGDAAPASAPSAPTLGPPAPPPTMRSANQPRPVDEAG